MIRGLTRPVTSVPIDAAGVPPERLGAAACGLDALEARVVEARVLVLLGDLLLVRLDRGLVQRGQREDPGGPQVHVAAALPGAGHVTRGRQPLGNVRHRSRTRHVDAEPGQPRPQLRTGAGPDGCGDSFPDVEIGAIGARETRLARPGRDHTGGADGQHRGQHRGDQDGDHVLGSKPLLGPIDQREEGVQTAVAEAVTAGPGAGPFGLGVHLLPHAPDDHLVPGGERELLDGQLTLGGVQPGRAPPSRS